MAGGLRFLVPFGGYAVDGLELRLSAKALLPGLSQRCCKRRRAPAVQPSTTTVVHVCFFLCCEWAQQVELAINFAEVFKSASLCVPTVTQPASLSVPQEASSLEQAHSIAMPPAKSVRDFYSGFVSKLVFPKPVDSQADNLYLIAQRYELLIAHDYDASVFRKNHQG